jgi:hypothetical protein
MRRVDDGHHRARLLSHLAGTRPLAELIVKIVCILGSGTHRAISAALAAASPGETILIRPGVYREEVVIDRPVCLAGVGGRELIILEASAGPCLRLTARRAVVRGLTLRAVARASGSSVFAVEAFQGLLSLSGCSITSDTYSSVAVSQTGRVLLSHCILNDSHESGLFAFGGGRIVARRCEMNDNRLSGACSREGGHIELVGCASRRSKESCGAIAFEGGSLEIADCLFEENTYSAVEARENSTVKVRSSVIRGCGGGLNIWKDSTCHAEEVLIERTKYSGFSAHGKGHIRAARCRVISPTQGSGVFLHDGGSAEMEDCDLVGSRYAGLEAKENSRATLTRCRIDGYTETSGLFAHQGANVRASGCVVRGGVFACAEVRTEASALLEGCTFEESSNGGGVYVHTQASAELTGCVLKGNRFPALEVLGSEVTATGCTLAGSKEASGALAWKDGLLTLERCELSGNANCGLAVREGGAVVARECRIQGHREHAGIGVAEGGVAEAVDCEVWDNGRGARVEGGELTLQSCHLHGNTLEAVSVVGDSKVHLHGCRLVGNGLPGVAGPATLDGCIL